MKILVTDRSLTLRYIPHNAIPLANSHEEVLKHLYRLWGFKVKLEQESNSGDISTIGQCPSDDSRHTTEQKYAERTDCEFYAGFTVYISPILRDLGLVFSEDQFVNAFEKRPQSQQALITDNNSSDKLHIKAGLPEQVISSQRLSLMLIQ